MPLHINGDQHTLLRETDGKDMPTKNPKTIPIIVATKILAPSFDLLSGPLQKRETNNYLIK